MGKTCKPKRPQRQETRRKKISVDRVDLFVASYVKNKYPTIYKEAVQFNDELRLKNPEKLDLRKTIAYRAWINDQKQNTNILHGHFDKFQLKVQLMNSNDVQKKAKPLSEGESVVETLAEGDVVCESPSEGESVVETLAQGDVVCESPAEGESTVEVAMRETLDISTIEPSLEAPVSDELFDQILEGLREDPDLSNIMASLEEEILYEEYGMDVHVSDDERLEHEFL